MELTDWIVALAVALIAIAFFCRRAPATWSPENRARRFAGMRTLALAALSLWMALLLIARGVFSTRGVPGVHAEPLVALSVAAALITLTACCAFRAIRLLKPRRLFAC